MSAAPPPNARHILTYAQSWRGGGVERVQLRLARGWIAAGRRVTLAIGDPSGPLATELPDGVAVIATGSADYRQLLGAMPALVDRTKPDLIFCPGNHYTSIAAWIRVRRGGACPPIVAKVSNALVRPDQSFLVAEGYRRWLRLHPRFITHVVAMTPAMATEAAAAMAMPAERISIIANPPARAIVGAALPDLPQGRFILGVGRLVPQKRWDRLIDALARLADPAINLVILGEGEERAALEAQIASLGLGDRVRLPGHAADPLPVIGRAALVALVSDFEGVPGVLREALALGTPVVATESSVAVREIVTGPALGTIIPADDAAALVGALDHWLVPGRIRPAPVPQPGENASDAYLALFDRLVERAVFRPST
ncbi:glycosyltransferase [Sphingomonas sp. So64.6b]|uniref:glycosyltransferase n=1 Tax=Sphingomonas sp. So64.6b TaxID=2997354 RepID=UPI0016045D6E|nr:glycosyltransferase [Sphingomonas sp. So64.6b]QNA85995.1 glycosyltransferase [Sphingomonas sp. So64.6b]